MCDEYGLNAANFHFEIKLITKNATQAPLSFFVCFHKKDRGAYIYNRAVCSKTKITRLFLAIVTLIMGSASSVTFELG